MEDLLIKDPYDSNLYQANLIALEKQQVDTVKLNDSNISIFLDVIISVKIQNSSIDISYNPNLIQFKSESEKLQLRREINSFFVNNGFILKNIISPIDIFKCGTELKKDKNTFHFDVNESILTNDDTKSLIKIFSMLIFESSIVNI